MDNEMEWEEGEEEKLEGGREGKHILNIFIFFTRF